MESEQHVQVGFDQIVAINHKKALIEEVIRAICNSPTGSEEPLFDHDMGAQSKATAVADCVLNLSRQMACIDNYLINMLTRKPIESSEKQWDIAYRG